jgi:exodeoxyribonuclease V beta subunit
MPTEHPGPTAIGSPEGFDIAGELPSGLMALEASAGTGKTYALSALAARFIAEEGITASQLCIVSFTEAATAELRGRVRARLVEAVEYLESGSVSHDDSVLAAIGTTVDAAERALRAQRLRDAVADFDAATIATIHGFCSRVLASAGAEPLPIQSGVDDIAEVVNDILLDRHVLNPDVVLASGRVVAGVQAQLSMPDARLFAGDPPNPGTNRKVTEKQLGQQVRAEAACEVVPAACEQVRVRRRSRRRQTFDGLLYETRELLTGPQATSVVRGLRDRYRVILIDEFQDTDRVQWDIFRTAFVDPVVPPAGHAPTVVLVGDPKQSIYRFRGAELSAYLDAVGAADQVATLTTNWRSDGALLDGLGRLLEDFTFGSDAVRFTPVQAAPRHEGARMSGDGGAPLQFRWVSRGPEGTLDAATARRVVSEDLIEVVADLLDGAATVPAEVPGGQRPVTARDIAILVRSNADASAFALALAAAGIPAATAANNSVLESQAAWHWEVLLRALEHPGSPGAVRAAALGWFLGYTPADLAGFDDEQLAGLHERMRRWSVDLLDRGVVGLMAVARAGGLHSRLLARAGGERNLTDVDHIAELLQGLTGGRPTAAGALLKLLRTAGSGAEGSLANEMLARRIDRDDDAVQVMTVHKAKGLEFPIVLCPYLWTTSSSAGVPHAHDAGVRWLDATWIATTSSSSATKRFRGLDRSESAGEGRRLVYVALTRAQHRCILWWAPVTTKGSSSLGELLEHRLGAPPAQPDQLQPLIDAGNGFISMGQVPVVRLGTSRSTRPDPASADPSGDRLAVAVANRVLDHSWRIWSFSGITMRARQRREAASIGLPEEDRSSVGVLHAATGGGTDEPADEHRRGNGEPMPAAALELSTAPAGTTFGTLVHEILELCDFAHPELETHLQDICIQALRYRPQPITAPALARGLAAAISAPLGGPLGTQRLRDLGRADRLDEMEFHLPLGRLRAEDIGRTLTDHLDRSDPFLPWAARLADSSELVDLDSVGRRGVPTGFDIDLSGQLTGSIDLIGRTPTGLPGAHRYWLADYKSNQLGAGCDYRQADLAEAMVHHEYALQATLYLVALHRYLRWRVPGYQIRDHLGGAAYLFVRGMDPTRPAAATRGVFWWQPAAAAIEALDHLFAHGAPR